MPRLRHPDLPGQEIEVSARAAIHHTRSGWEPVEDTAAVPTPEPTTETPRRRRAQKEEE